MRVRALRDAVSHQCVGAFARGFVFCMHAAGLTDARNDNNAQFASGPTSVVLYRSSFFFIFFEIQICARANKKCSISDIGLRCSTSLGSVPLESG